VSAGSDPGGSSDALPGYALESLPLEPIPPGRNVLVAGPTFGGARELALRLMADERDDDEGAVIVTTDSGSDALLSRCRQLGADLDDGRVGLVDCAGSEPDADRLRPARVLSVSSPGDFTGIGMRYSKLCAELRADGVDRIRTGFHSLSTLLSFGDLRRTSRFVHTVAGRNAAIDGLGVLLVDPAIHDDRTLGTVANFCDGRIQVREADPLPELRVRGIPGPREWTPFEPEP
jgi:KaiC/GvpD/RAD55 family RecA-like ATPase